jgi:hypothetical protein
VEPIITSGAPATCQFSLADQNFDNFCPTTCSGTLSPDVTETPEVLDNFDVVTTAPEITENPTEMTEEPTDTTDNPTELSSSTSEPSKVNQLPEVASVYDSRGVDFTNGRIFLNALKRGES